MLTHESNFYKEHEYTQNKFILRIIKWTYLSLLLLLIGKFVGIFPKIKLIILVSAFLIFFIITQICNFILKKNNFNPLIKYIILLTGELVIAYLSISQGFEIFISYILVILASCIYFDKKFTLHISIITYIIMIICIQIRAFSKQHIFTVYTDQVKWALAYSVGLTLEFILNVLAIRYITYRNKNIITENFYELEKQKDTQKNIITSYVAMLTKRHTSLEIHLKQCAEYVQVICLALSENEKYKNQLTEENIYYIETSALLHDIGLISTPEEILDKRTTLTDSEKMIIQDHTKQGKKLLQENMSSINRDYLKISCDMAMYHHEHWDGSGYPRGLQGNQIPLAARIMCAANILDNTLHSHQKIYQLSFDESISRIKQMANKEIDPDIVEVILNQQDKLRKIYEQN